MKENDFKPYIPAEKVTAEFTVTSVVMGIILAVVFGAANAYLGLRVGMTVSASIPAAVISMGVIHIILKKSSVLESNLVQTVGSAGESLAAGAIFTMPALFLWAREGKMDKPSIATITIIALIGGVLGVLFMVPLRNALIVKEHNTLPYPEGHACAEVILAGEDGGSSAAATVFAGMGISAAIKFIIDGLKIGNAEPSFAIPKYNGEIGTQVYPAVMSVGYICGPRISSYLFGGSILSWLVFIPAIVLFGKGIKIYPGTETIGAMYKAGGAGAIWSSYIRYIGAGALAAGGIISLIKSLPLISSTFKDSIKSMKNGVGSDSNLRTEQDMNMKTILILIGLMVLATWLVPAVPVNLGGALLVVIFGFFFATVSSRMVGLVGSSNNPVSGMSIATLLVATIIIRSVSGASTSGMKSAIAIGSIICVIAAIAGDTSQDLKTGFLLGATPKKQQYGEIIGIVASAFAIGGVLYLLDTAWGFGSKAIPAPQAMLMKMIVEGIMSGKLPWALVFIGVFTAIVVEIIGIPVLPFAIGMYLPIHLNACMMIGGLIRLFLNKKKYKNNDKEETVNKGVLYCSGMIAGEGLIGILLAIFAVIGIDSKLDLSSKLNFSPATADIVGLVWLAVGILLLLKFTIWNKRK